MRRTVTIAQSTCYFCAVKDGNVEITREQFVHSFFILNDHNRSTASTPICSPQFSPEMVMNAGALQPFAVRQVPTPLPPFPPKTKPPLIMHFEAAPPDLGAE